MPDRSKLSDARTGRHVVRDVISDLDAWNLTPFGGVRYLMRISAYHKRLLEQSCTCCHCGDGMFEETELTDGYCSECIEDPNRGEVGP